MESEKQIERSIVGKYFFQGAMLGIVMLIIAFISQDIQNAASNDLNWISRWVVLPAVLVSMAGGFGGMFYFLTTEWRDRGVIERLMTLLLNGMVYMVLISAAFLLSMNVL